MNVTDQVTSWCEEEGILESEGDDETAALHLKVHPPILGTDPTGDEPTLDVTYTDGGDRIRVFGSVSFDDVFWEAMRELDLDEFIGRIGPTLDALPSSCFVDYEAGVLRSITLADEVFLDGLSKDRLVQSLRGVNKSVRLALWAVRPLIDLLLNPGEYAWSGEPPQDTIEGRGCSHCGNPVSPEQSFCTQCGARLGSSVSEGKGSGT